MAESKLAVLSMRKEIEAREAAVKELQTRQADAAGRVGEWQAQIDALEEKNAAITREIESLHRQAAEQLRQEAAGSGDRVRQLQAARAEGSGSRPSCAASPGTRRRNGKIWAGRPPAWRRNAPPSARKTTTCCAVY